MISQLYPESWLSTQSGKWSRYQIATTVRKENETASSSIYDAAHPGVLPSASCELPKGRQCSCIYVLCLCETCTCKGKGVRCS